MTTVMRWHLREQEENAFNRGYSEEEMQASELRKEFIRKYVVDFDTNLYSTQVERDWAYIAKREFRYDVQIKSLGYGFIFGNLAWSAAIFAKKRFVLWPLPLIWGIASAYYYPVFFQKHNKKLFDMCNIGVEYKLGNERNKVLEKCNRILDREDF